MARCAGVLGAILSWSLAASAAAQTAAEANEDEAVGQSVNYVFATELGSGL